MTAFEVRSPKTRGPSSALRRSLLRAPVRLYENHCVVCHTPNVHRRVPRLLIDLRDLRLIVSSWTKQENLRWTEDDIEDVVHYLDRTHYRFEK